MVLKGDSSGMLFKIDNDSSNYTKVKRVTFKSIGWKELDFQNLLSNHINDFISNNELMIIFNERQFQEEPDILALDKVGNLYIFELKRWSSNEENLLQVLRYGQLYGKSNYQELNEMYTKYLHLKDELVDLSTMHQRYFMLDDGLKLSEGDFNLKQFFIVVTNGLDQKTVEAITYWKKSGLNIDAIVYWIFDINGENYIEFNMYSPIEGFLEYEENTYVLNTNHTNNRQHTDEMINEKKAAAYYPGWREKIKKFQKGDTIFLYKSGFGIVAYGNASGNLEMKDCDMQENYEYFMKLENFVKLKKPFSASQMKQITKQGFNFRQTLFSINEECKLALIKEIRKNYI
jgi:hypothetical protein